MVNEINFCNLISQEVLGLIVQVIQEWAESNTEGQHVSKAAQQWATKMGSKYTYAVWLIEMFMGGMLEGERTGEDVLEFQITIASLEELSCSALC